MGKGFRNKIRAVDFYCTDKERKHNYHERDAPVGGWNQPVKPQDHDKLPRSFRKLVFVTGEGKGSKRPQSDTQKGSKGKSSGKKLSQSKSSKPNKNPQGENAPRVLQPEKKYEFKSELREGESFHAFKHRLEREKQLALFAQAQKLTPINAKRRESLKRRKDRKKVKQLEKEARIAEEDKADFPGAEKIPFGVVADRPPNLKNIPKAPAAAPGISVLADFLRKKQASGEDQDAEQRKIDALQRHALVQVRNEELLRQRSQLAYKDAKRRKLSARPTKSSESAPD